MVPADVVNVPLPLPPALRVSVPAVSALVPLGLNVLPKLTVPVWMSSVPPVLFKSTAPVSVVVPVATVLRSRPALITTSAVPPSPWMVWSFWIRNCPPALLSNTTCDAPPLLLMLPVPVQVVVP